MATAWRPLRLQQNPPEGDHLETEILPIFEERDSKFGIGLNGFRGQLFNLPVAKGFRDSGRGEQNPKNGRIAFKSGIHELL